MLEIVKWLLFALRSYYDNGNTLGDEALGLIVGFLISTLFAWRESLPPIVEMVTQW